MEKDISIIIVNYNTAEIVRNCINSVLPQTGLNYEIIVADNASSDNSVELLRKFGDKIKLIVNDEDIGFGKACNQAEKYTTGKYLFFLNPDTWMHEPNDLKKIYEFAQANPQCGLITTNIVGIDGVENAKPKYFYPGEKTILETMPPMPGKIAWVLGAVIIIPANIFREINGFDEDFFLYSEDLDICLRIRKAGYEIGHISDVTITHISGVTEINSSKYDWTLRRHKAYILFYQKHYSSASIKKIAQEKIAYARPRAIKHKIFNILLFFRRKYHKERLSYYQAICDVYKDYLPY